ncbi:hypothetical protein QFC19_008031 [Naganishia cerealis]|uniref:Uncharacterized protein n=1 Tax=Naganishia cerealis TaxID=610337 RepID=A0ACC2V478_9TREE|nr:hypothetical protein QFC19_008031 [Naganishia cerealis]
MTTSPPNNISLIQRDSYGFGANFAHEGAGDGRVEDDDNDQEEELGAFTQDDPQNGDLVLPTDLKRVREGETTTDSDARGIIPDSSYGALLRSSQGQREGQPADGGARERGEDDIAGLPNRFGDRNQTAAILDLYSASDIESTSGPMPEPDKSTRYWDTRSDSDFGEFAQPSRPGSHISSESFGFPFSGPSTPLKRNVGNGLDQRVTSSPGSPYRRPSHLRKSTLTTMCSDPSVSRLRSHFRTPSVTTLDSAYSNSGVSAPAKNATRPPAWNISSNFSALSRTSSSYDLEKNPAQGWQSPQEYSQAPVEAADSNTARDNGHDTIDDSDVTGFVFHTMKDCTKIVFKSGGEPTEGTGERTPTTPKAGFLRRWSGVTQTEESEPAAQPDWGLPTVAAVNGLIAVGTESGWVAVMGFKQELRRICGTDAIAKASGAVTAVAISPDATFVAVGHQSGNIYLYELSAANAKPARSAPALTASALATGKKEGHLSGTAITQLAFVGRRHTAIVSGDETGRAFWWSLGKVMGVESNDVIRLLGNSLEAKVLGEHNSADQITPRSDSSRIKAKSNKDHDLFVASPLPVGKNAHPSDIFGMIALLTDSKLMIVGLKPSARTWYKRSRQADGGRSGRMIGCAAWLPPQSPRTGLDKLNDPVLAYSWGNHLRFLKIQVAPAERSEQEEAQKAPIYPVNRVEFVEGRIWKEESPIVGLSWLNSSHILIATPSYLALLDIRSMRRVEKQNFNWLFELSCVTDGKGSNYLVGTGNRLCTYKGKIFAMTESDIRVGSVLLWADRILALCHAGDFLAAINLTIQYYTSNAVGNTIGLPVSLKARQKLLGTRALSLMRASLRYAFSEDRLTDGTYSSNDGRGVDLTPLFEGLAECCFHACLEINERTFLFEDVFEAYANVGIQGIYLQILARNLLEDRVADVPPQLIQALIAHYANRAEYQKAERIIWRVDPMSLDINQSIVLCQAHGLWDAYIYVHNQCLLDYTTPIAKILELIEGTGFSSPDHPYGTTDPVTQHTVRLYQYIETILSGYVFPSRQAAPARVAEEGRKAVYACIFSLTVPRDPAFSHLSAEDAYPVLQRLLHLDTEALLHTLDVAFEDGYLNDNHGFLMSRQLIINILLEVMNPQQYHAGDMSLLHIFVARNLPKYPQFILLSPSTLHQILQSLASDLDPSTRDDRELAAESLLSTYTPYDTEAIYQQFREAGFWRILRALYTNEGNWIEVLRANVADDSLLSDEFLTEVDRVLTMGLRSDQASKLRVEMENTLPQMLEASPTHTATLLDHYLPDLHPEALRLLQGQSHKQLGYLTTLLEPHRLTDTYDKMDTPSSTTHSRHISDDMYVTYLSLLCEMDEDRLLPFIETHKRIQTISEVSQTLERHNKLDVLVWFMLLRGEIEASFDKLAQVMYSATSQLIQSSKSTTQDPSASLMTITKMARMGMKMAQHTSTEKCFSREDSWYHVLSQTLGVIRRTQSLSPEESEAILPTLRGVVQDELSDLLSNSGSSNIAFPRLFKRLAEDLDDNPEDQSSETYAEIKIILTSMLRTYVSEEEILKITTKIIDGDLQILFFTLVKAKARGWKAHQDICDQCGLSVLLSEPAANEMSRRGEDPGRDKAPVLIAQSGQTKHLACIATPL